MKCEGNCSEHVGEVVLVEVRDRGHEWGEFYYCETAIKDDRSRGLVVEISPFASLAAAGERFEQTLKRLGY